MEIYWQPYLIGHQRLCPRLRLKIFAEPIPIGNQKIFSRNILYKNNKFIFNKRLPLRIKYKNTWTCPEHFYIIFSRREFVFIFAVPEAKRCITPIKKLRHLIATSAKANAAKFYLTNMGSGYNVYT